MGCVAGIDTRLLSGVGQPRPPLEDPVEHLVRVSSFGSEVTLHSARDDPSA